MVPKVVFLVGMPRSGTTWLQLLLSQSEQVATTNETHLFNQFTRSLFASWVQLAKSSRETGLNHLMSEENFIVRVKAFTDGVLGLIGEKKPQASIILEKTPGHTWVWRDILKVYPDAFFIHLIRDPRAVVASLRAAGRDWGKTWASTSVIENAESWLRTVGTARDISTATANYMEIRYEALMQAPADTLAMIFDRLSISEPYDSCLVFVDRCKPDNLAKGVENTAWDTSKEPAGFFRGAGVDGWRKDLTGLEIADIETITAPLASPLGYFMPRNRSLPSGRHLVFKAMRRIDRWWSWQQKKMLRRL